MNNIAFGMCILLRHLSMFNFRKGVREVILKRGPRSETRPRSHFENGFPIRKCPWEPPGKVREGKCKTVLFGPFGPRPKIFHM